MAAGQGDSLTLAASHGPKTQGLSFRVSKAVEPEMELAGRDGFQATAMHADQAAEFPKARPRPRGPSHLSDFT
ncbi:hypothetical protein CEP52_012263 [Fusarium oligoseptatum]|uniref:Uncharacterized protein n=1 Tax=Fusarium oligoseptatum TaxID=2604345 RepID=A0A428SZ29_9HYPO|nr:hypothetical protein CEP52_012263 [Fusarium oligoseptatum]